MNLSICYLTGRADPYIEWLLEAIAMQRRESDRFELVVIDALGRSAAALVPDDALIARSVHVVRAAPPRPNPWQGPHRITDRNWWAKSTAANTAICLASHDYLVFVDDRSIPGPAWLSAIRAGERKRASVLAGAYERLETRDDQTIHVTDHRFKTCPMGRINCGGGWCFGCCIALPLAWALEINGFEEGCDSLTGEDYIFGMMLANAGHRIDYTTELFVTLDRTRGSEGTRNGDTGFQGNSGGKGGYAATDKGKSPNDKSHAALARFGTRRRTEFTPDLTAIRERLRAGDPDPWPKVDPEMRDWYDWQPVREMRPPP